MTTHNQTKFNNLSKLQQQITALQSTPVRSNAAQQKLDKKITLLKKKYNNVSGLQSYIIR